MENSSISQIVWTKSVKMHGNECEESEESDRILVAKHIILPEETT